MSHTLVVALLLAALYGVSFSQNQPPTVFAGNDTAVRIISELDDYRFTPTITDDGVYYADPHVVWAQIAGPQGGVEIMAPEAPRSLLKLLKVGVYSFVISVDDSQFVVRDTVNVTVQDSIPFAVVAPVAGEQVQGGSSYLVRWRIDPPGTWVIGSYSTDGGVSFKDLIVNRMQDSTFLWNVPVIASNKCQIRIKDYFNLARGNACSGLFSITSTGIVRGIHSSPSFRSMGGCREVYALDGRRLDPRISVRGAISTPMLVITRVKGAPGGRLKAAIVR